MCLNNLHPADEQQKAMNVPFDLQGFENVETYKVFAYFESVRKDNPKRSLKQLLGLLEFTFADQIIDSLKIKADLTKKDFDLSNSADYALYCCRTELTDAIRSGFTSLISRTLKEIQEKVTEEGAALCTEFIVDAMTYRVNWDQITDYFVREFQNKEA